MMLKIDSVDSKLEEDTSDSPRAKFKRFLKHLASAGKQRASEIVLEVPAATFHRIGKNEGVNSLHRETKHFSGRAMTFWFLMVGAALTLLLVQTGGLLSIYFNKPTLSQVSFIVSDNGMRFPAVTICNFNPIRTSYVKELNVSGDLSPATLQYLLRTDMDAMVSYSSSFDRKKLNKSHDEATVYVKNHPEFKITKFLRSAGYDCPQMFKMCFFGGRRFDCCKYARTVLTGLGKCYQLDLSNSGQKWLMHQKSPSAESGLQIIADAHLDEAITSSVELSSSVFSNLFENGFRYYVHEPGSVPFLASEGVSASPSTTVYSAIKMSTHQLLSVDEWGNCTNRWPADYNTTLMYSSQACKSLCLANHFEKHCGCSPFTYNIDGKRSICTPFQTVTCIDKHMLNAPNGSRSDETAELVLPDCSECRIECESTSYHMYNSYGHGFNDGALQWLRENSDHPDRLDPDHFRKNFVVMNVFFCEMFYTAYSQVQATTLTEIISDIGGNMGMFLGMSVITITELSLYFSKMFWIVASKKRRNYMFHKKKNEKEKKQHLDQVVEDFREMKRAVSSGNVSRLATPTPSRYKISPVCEKSAAVMRYDDFEHSKVAASDNKIVELKIDVDDLQAQIASSGEPSPTLRVGVQSRKSSENALRRKSRKVSPTSVDDVVQPKFSVDGDVEQHLHSPVRS